MSAHLVIADRLLELGEESVPPPSLDTLWREVVPLLRRHRGDKQLCALTQQSYPREWAVAQLSSSGRQSLFHDAVLQLVWQGEHPSGGRLQELLRGKRTKGEGLNGEECKWRTEVLLALGWSAPPPGEYGRWMPPGQRGWASHKWGSEVDGVWECRRCGRLRWVGTVVGAQPRYRYADDDDQRLWVTRSSPDGGAWKAGRCEPREGT